MTNAATTNRIDRIKNRYAAACACCGGWTTSGGMAQHAEESPCVCNEISRISDALQTAGADEVVRGPAPNSVAYDFGMGCGGLVTVLNDKSIVENVKGDEEVYKFENVAQWVEALRAGMEENCDVPPTPSQGWER